MNKRKRTAIWRGEISVVYRRRFAPGDTEGACWRIQTPLIARMLKQSFTIGRYFVGLLGKASM